MTCCPSENSDQPVHQSRQIRSFAVPRMGSIGFMVQIDSKDSDQTGHMSSLIRVLAVCLGHFDGFCYALAKIC